jgi:hypothetical protein
MRITWLLSTRMKPVRELKAILTNSLKRDRKYTLFLLVLVSRYKL